jgi:hypothetical protein
MLDRVVEVIRPAIDGEIFVSIDGQRFRCVVDVLPRWVVTSKTPLPWMVATGPIKGRVLMFTHRVIFDACLREINGPHLVDEVLQEMSA